MIQGIGTDIVYIPRLIKIINTYPSFLKKVYTNKELELAKSYDNPLTFYATRFAAKEAIFKATGAKFEFNEIEILKDNFGKPIPHILIHDDIKIELSLSFDEDYAVAMCIAIF